MKMIIPTITLCLMAGTEGLSATQQAVGSKLTQATVFFSGAELTHSAQSALARGVNEISIEGLSPNIDLNSLRISATNNVVVTSYEFSVDYLTSAKEATPAVKKLEESVKLHTESLEKIRVEQNVNREMAELLKSGVQKNVSGSESGLSVDELVKAMNYYKTKSMELEAEAVSLNKKYEEAEKELRKVQAQLDQQRTKGDKTSGVLKLNLSSPAAGNCDFTVIYFTQAASWAPYYDINVPSTDRPIVIAAKSKVSQTTGLDWERVKLTLSTAVPSNGKVAPLFSAWFLRDQPLRLRGMAKVASPAMVQNAYSYDMVEEQSPQVMLRGRASGIDVSEPLVIINGQPATKAEMDALDPGAIKDVQVLKDEQATAVYGARGAAGVIIVTLKSGMDDYVTATEGDLNVVYEIDLPYSIPGNGKVQNIDLQNKETKAEFKYYCAPKLDPETYLLAEIADWQKLGLLSGRANITYDGTYIGETYIDASTTQEKLTLTLGTDKRVAVKREKLQDFSSRRTMGSDISNTLTYQLTVRNNQNKSIKMVLKDQYPISTQKNITVNLLDKTTRWTANKEDVGVITWEGDIAPGQTETYQISYTVRYPKDLNLNL